VWRGGGAGEHPARVAASGGRPGMRRAPLSVTNSPRAWARPSTVSRLVSAIPFASAICDRARCGSGHRVWMLPTLGYTHTPEPQMRRSPEHRTAWEGSHNVRGMC
jgi:hypothetical protein